ncbi:hypothetical protein F8M41_010132 [Gigaspora margarita]|uniref:Uncharacterized protein n=1 Tax=Gigaspora margarita TaxID=4874 RepID=A0A8H3X357_GIGMA|nr:hypothetical protein F8M41_010132 [Gigaspora margarita]
MDPNIKKRPTAKSVNFQVGFWNEEILSSDDDNEIKRQFLEINSSPQVIDTIKNLSQTSEPIDSIDILQIY